jgi:hypothetical protein
MSQLRLMGIGGSTKGTLWPVYAITEAAGVEWTRSGVVLWPTVTIFAGFDHHFMWLCVEYGRFTHPDTIFLQLHGRYELIGTQGGAGEQE